MRTACSIRQFIFAEQISSAAVLAVLLLTDPIQAVHELHIGASMAPKAPFQHFHRAERTPVGTNIDDDAFLLARCGPQSTTNRLAPPHRGQGRPKVDDDIAVRIVPAFGEHAHRHHRLDIAALMTCQELHSLLDWRPAGDDGGFDAKLPDTVQGFFCDANVGAEPG